MYYVISIGSGMLPCQEKRLINLNTILISLYRYFAKEKFMVTSNSNNIGSKAEDLKE